MTTLPFQQYRFTLYCDSYFSNTPLFEALRNCGICASGTARPNSSQYPRYLKLIKEKFSFHGVLSQE